MADWQFRLDLKDAWKKAENDEINTVELSKIIVERIKALVVEIRERSKSKDAVERFLARDFPRMATNLEKDVLVFFEEIVDAENDDTELFDYAMSELYDWADTSLDDKWGGRKMCWVSTVV